jgi:hypothetical protein
MRTAYIQLAETILDTISFFFVTTDLYGRTNLETLNARLSGSLGRSLSLRFDRLFIGVFVALLILSLALWYASYRTHYAWYQANLPLAEAIVQDFTGLAVLLIAVLALPPAYAMFMLLIGVVRFALWLLQTLQLQGVLLSLGTILFLAARAVSVYESIAAEGP